MFTLIATMIVAGIVLWLTISAIVFVGGFTHCFLKDVSKEIAADPAKLKIIPSNFNKTVFLKLLGAIGLIVLLAVIGDNSASPNAVVASIVGLLALSCYCFHRGYKGYQQNKKIY